MREKLDEMDQKFIAEPSFGDINLNILINNCLWKKEKSIKTLTIEKLLTSSIPTQKSLTTPLINSKVL